MIEWLFLVYNIQLFFMQSPCYCVWVNPSMSHNLSPAVMHLNSAAASILEMQKQLLQCKLGKWITCPGAMICNTPMYFLLWHLLFVSNSTIEMQHGHEKWLSMIIFLLKLLASPITQMIRMYICNCIEIENLPWIWRWKNEFYLTLAQESTKWAGS